MQPHEGDTDVALDSEQSVSRPSLYRVIMHNDDYTPMDFVILVLVSIFRKSEAEAVEVMLTVHKRGQGTAGIYPHAIAETKIAEAHQMAKENGHPFRLSMEPV